MEKQAQKIQCEICKNLIHNTLYEQHIAECFYRQQQESGNLENLINQSQQFLQQSQQQQQQQFNMEDKTQCPNCGDKIKYSELHLHDQQCQNKDIKCEYCAEVFPKDLMREHFNFCQERKNFHSQFSNQSIHNHSRNHNQQNNSGSDSDEQLPNSNQFINPHSLFQAIFQNLNNNGSQRQHQHRQFQNQQEYDQYHQQRERQMRERQQQEQEQQRQQQQNQQQQSQQLPNIFQLLLGGSRNSGRVFIRQSGGGPQMGHQPSPAIVMLQHLFQNGSLENYDYSNNGGVSKDTLKEFPTFKFQKKQGQDEEQGKCAICMCEYEDQEEVKMLDCTHKYHVECIDKWLEKNSTCPVCKTDMRN